MRYYRKRCLLLLLLPLCLASVAVYYFTIDNRHQVDYKQSLLDDVFTALLKVVEFLSTDYPDINMDGLYGYRICQGMLIGTLQDCSHESFRCPDKLKYRIQDIIARLDELADRALPFVEQKDEDYYNNYLPVLKAPFTFKYIPEKFHHLPEQSPLTPESYNGQTGDKCFGGIMGTLIDGDGKVPPCTFVDGCWELMTVKGTIGYFTTHQLLYFLFGQHSGCSQQLGDRTIKDMGVSLRDWQRHLCQQIYLDATYREYNLQMEVRSEDLFLEQIALCGVLGFQNFFNETWMRMVLTWQNPRGCFTVPAPAMEILVEYHRNRKEMEELEEEETGGDGPIEKRDDEEARNRLHELRLANYKHRINLSKRYELINKARGARTGRSLMTEIVMGTDCLSHKTGLGAAVLGSYVRYLVSELHARK
ncbi:hypothetical protein BsWGS_21809 [Bradybaena similaris]